MCVLQYGGTGQPVIRENAFRNGPKAARGRLGEKGTMRATLEEEEEQEPEPEFLSA